MALILIDTNVLIYAFSKDAKSSVALDALGQGCRLSVQALNEFTRVARRRLAMTWDEVDEALWLIRLCCERLHPVDFAVHELGLRIAERYRLGLFDSTMIAAGLLSGCTTMLSEDLQDGFVIMDRITVRNPFT